MKDILTGTIDIDAIGESEQESKLATCQKALINAVESLITKTKGFESSPAVFLAKFQRIYD